jgi:hypothetical protein
MAVNSMGYMNQVGLADIEYHLFIFKTGSWCRFRLQQVKISARLGDMLSYLFEAL